MIQHPNRRKHFFSNFSLKDLILDKNRLLYVSFWDARLWQGLVGFVLREDPFVKSGPLKCGTKSLIF